MTATGFRAALALAAIAASLPLAAPAQAQFSSGDAEAIRKLDIMLMVSSLRCRFGEDNFQADYARFSAKHLPALNAAYQSLHGDLARQYGAKRAKLMLDKISVSMANRYGQGHPWLDCAALKTTTRELADRPAGAELHVSAQHLLADRPSGAPMLAARK
ncbi:S-adenosyl-L-homocysteine hydrolase [Parerythrobacter aestuarii]|uniref:S-adenosyl-L-homocysteine hydrolase n=1 Tax=Parerythrobacter aestuarii TaxID=3020909 RepID=UPI0024DEE8B5|nr:S-adenosyl-L-homocysteine hydrolase [Parerythrobacter aestuarii]